jgi:arylsulfatase A-like enzyme
MVVHWPKGIKAKNEIRTQFSHVIDVAPRVLQAIGLPEPKVVNGVKQIPMAGTSLVYTFEDAKARERHTTQYFEVAGKPRDLPRWLVRAHDPQGAVGSQTPPLAGGQLGLAAV